MSTPEDADLLRSVTREVLAEVLPGLLEEALTAQPEPNGNGNGHHEEAVPQVPAPPVAKVHRPSGWRPPAESATTPAIGTPQVRQLTGGLATGGAPNGATLGAPASRTAARDIEVVDLRDDADLDAFVRSLVHRFENPRDRMAIRSGKLR
ncbi:MAG TPA: hypothetical protein VJN72_06730, partial [Gaiellales bacterium]|nr:hypothetical protein [Gaiellales bacterium]